MRIEGAQVCHDELWKQRQKKGSDALHVLGLNHLKGEKINDRVRVTL